jgi:hypothetical protein
LGYLVGRPAQQQHIFGYPFGCRAGRIVYQPFIPCRKQAFLFADFNNQIHKCFSHFHHLLESFIVSRHYPVKIYVPCVKDIKPLSGLRGGCRLIGA